MTSSSFRRECRWRFLLFSFGFALFSLYAAGPVSATPSEGSESSDKPEDEAEVSGNVVLPSWEEGACREQFDVRIWPKATVVWLEQENLRAMIADPKTSEQERQHLKMILAMQRAWRVNTSS